MPNPLCHCPNLLATGGSKGLSPRLNRILSGSNSLLGLNPMREFLLLPSAFVLLPSLILRYLQLKDEHLASLLLGTRQTLAVILVNKPIFCSISNCSKSTSDNGQEPTVAAARAVRNAIALLGNTYMLCFSQLRSLRLGTES